MARDRYVIAALTDGLETVVSGRTTAGSRRITAVLLLLGLVTIGLYGLLAFRYPLAAGLAQPRAGWGGMTSPTLATPIYNTSLYLGLTLVYTATLVLLIPTSGVPHPVPASPERGRIIIILLTWLACCGILFTAAPSGESHDIYDYVFRGRMMVEYGGNPLVEVPSQYNRADYYRYVAWHSHVDTYGPIWEMASAATAIVTREVLKTAGWWGSSAGSCPNSPRSCRNLIGYLSGYRLLATGLTLTSALLIASMVRRSRPDLVLASLAAWLWSPLLLVSTALGAHNDALMVALLLLMLWLLQRQLWFPALLALVLAAHVKLIALVVGPPVFLWLVRCCGWRRAIILSVSATVVLLPLSWLLYAPFGGWQSLPRMLGERAAFLGNSPWKVLNYYLNAQLGRPIDGVRRLTVQFPSVLFAAGALFVSLWMLDFRPQRWKAVPEPDWSDDRRLWRSVAVVTFLYLLVGSFWFQHWYVLWVLAPAALMPDSVLTRWLLPWLGFGALAANVIGDFALQSAMTTQAKTAALSLIVTIIWGPILIASGLLLGRRRQSTDPAQQ